MQSSAGRRKEQVQIFQTFHYRALQWIEGGVSSPPHEGSFCRICVHLFLYSLILKVSHGVSPYPTSYYGMGIARLFLKWRIVPPGGAEDCSTIVFVSKTLFLSDKAVSTIIDAHIQPHSLQAVTWIIKEKPVSRQVHSGPGDRIGLAVKTLAREFMAIPKTAVLHFLGQIAVL